MFLYRIVFTDVDAQNLIRADCSKSCQKMKKHAELKAQTFKKDMTLTTKRFGKGKTMNKYGELIDNLIYIKDNNDLTMWERDVINDACNSLEREGRKEDG